MFIKIMGKYHTATPSDVKEFLYIEKNDKVVLRKTKTLNDSYLNALTGTLLEWASNKDNESYHDL